MERALLSALLLTALRALFDRAIDAIFFFDDEGRCMDANPAATKLLGIGREDITKRRIGDFSSTTVNGGIPLLFERLRAAGTLTGEWSVIRPDGSARVAEYRAVSAILPGVHFLISHDITDSRIAEQSLRQLTARLMHLRDEERSRIARQLHDTTVQSLTAVRFHLVRVTRFAAMNEAVVKNAIAESLTLTEQSIAEIRTLSYLLHPPMIEEAGLLPSLQWYVRGFEERSGITTTLDAPVALERMPREIETAVFRIVQEALTNVQRHSASAVARVAIERHDGQLRVIIEDHGRGLPPELRGDPIAMRSVGVGLAGIEQHARELGGTMNVQSDDHGTQVEATLAIGKELFPREIAERRRTGDA